MTSTTDTNTRYVPTQADIDAASNVKVKSWRISDGKIRHGSEQNPPEEVLDNIVGTPTRFGIVEPFETQEGETVPAKFRVELTTPDGERFSLQARAGRRSALDLMGALVLWDGVSFISITPRKDDKGFLIDTPEGKKKVFMTYTNVKQIEGPTKMPELRYDMNHIERDAREAHLIEELSKRSEWKPWVGKDSDSDSAPWDALSTYLEGLGFARYAAQEEYNAILEENADKKVKDFTAEDWADSIAWMKTAVKKNKLPDSLKAEKPDPFADE